MTYFDKNGKQITAGMYIKHINGDIEEVYSNWDHDDLGINASNKKFNENHPESNIPEQIYPLSQFNLSEWEIV